MRPVRSIGAVLFLSAVSCVSANAGARLQIKGSYTGVDHSQVLEIGEDHTLTSVVDEGLGYILEAPNDKTPMQYAAGPCGGFMEFRDGRASGHGYCVRTNPSGGKWIVQWELTPDMENGLSGKWKITGVEGDAEGWTGAGTWGPVVSTTPGHYIAPLEGWLEEP